MLRHLDYPPIWLAGFAALVWLWATAGLPGVVAPAPWLQAVAVGLIACGLGLMGMAVLAFARARTTVVPHRVPSALVSHGIYRLSRNPIYLGDVLVLIGWALWLGAPGALVLVPGLAYVLQRRFILPEEARMAAQFGPAFQAFAARTRRWI